MRTLVFAFCTLFLVSCGNSTDTAENGADTTKMDYAYTIEHPDNWEWGSKENTKVALQAVKDFETANFDNLANGFGDTVVLRFDNYEDTLTNAELIKMFKDDRSQMNGVRIKMEDFESVKAKTGDVEYVSLWYKQYNEDKSGKVDSMAVMDDMRMKNGKIVELDEKVRRFPKK